MTKLRDTGRREQRAGPAPLRVLGLPSCSLSLSRVRKSRGRLLPRKQEHLRLTRSQRLFGFFLFSLLLRAGLEPRYRARARDEPHAIRSNGEENSPRGGALGSEARQLASVESRGLKRRVASQAAAAAGGKSLRCNWRGSLAPFSLLARGKAWSERREGDGRYQRPPFPYQLKGDRKEGGGDSFCPRAREVTVRGEKRLALPFVVVFFLLRHSPTPTSFRFFLLFFYKEGRRASPSCTPSVLHRTRAPLWPFF